MQLHRILYSNAPSARQLILMSLPHLKNGMVLFKRSLCRLAWGANHSVVLVCLGQLRVTAIQPAQQCYYTQRICTF